MTPITSPSPSAPRSAALIHPSVLIADFPKVARSPLDLVRRERLEADDCKSVLDPRQCLNPLGHEVADIDSVVQVTLHQEVVLTGGRIDFGDHFDALCRLVGDDVGPAEIAFDHDEDRLHADPITL